MNILKKETWQFEVATGIFSSSPRLPSTIWALCFCPPTGNLVESSVVSPAEIIIPPRSPCFAGACWPSLRRPPSAQLLLGGWGLHLQVLRGDPHRPLPQGRQAQPRHPVDHKGGAQAQGDARPDLGGQEEPRPGQGPQVPPDHRRLPPRRLEEAQHPAAAPLSLEGARDLYIHKINILFMVTHSTPSFFQLASHSELTSYLEFFKTHGDRSFSHFC